MSAGHRHHKRRRGPGRALLRWHRRIGVLLSAIFIVICLTGVLLNHSLDLKLNQRIADADWIYRWYGMTPEGELLHYPTPDGSISHLDGSLYFEDKRIDRSTTPVAIVTLDAFLAVASESEVFLLSPSGDLIEVLRDNALPPGDVLGATTRDRQTLLLQSSEGLYQSDPDILTWQKRPESLSLPPLSATEAPAELRKAILEGYRGEGLSWNRILLDLHSGRFFGAAGKWVADLSALGLIVLTLSGILYTVKYLKKARERAFSRSES
ncbi:PepSY-associated TM helix domain-containing protein [Pelagicoccus sp. SDUM812003]|uniref:PepSY-associated TM helix domain-containing protein n=1 Tax=Pelagicoccus sp. SDUM812003 TaxID=3041267 RepID=UPI00280FD099|nr:PepSY-associated TM helix domain-containing protein [Pelagicoccus sp. SDUM812003]MDQ8205236.1 PepSY-associated TM helix domain-containing protein [Pelagicoccus sp. SDUM812003]